MRLVSQVSILCILLFTTAMFERAVAQEKPAPEWSQDSLIDAAREIMQAAGYCALITVDSTGHPQARVMDAVLPEDNMIVWMATNPRTRKVRQIRRDSRVTLFYFDKDGPGTVSLTGHAQLIIDPEEKVRRWKEEWTPFYPDRQTDYILISVIPEKLEVVSVKHNIVGDKITWATPTVFFNHGKSEK